MIEHGTQRAAVFVLLRMLLAPRRPVFRGGANGCVFAVVFVGADHQLHVGEQRGNAIVALVADHLRHRLRHVYLRCFALDHHPRNAVHKQHNIWPRCAFTLRATRRAQHRKLGSHVIHIVFRVLPVDVIQRKAAYIALHRLLQRHPQREQVIHMLVGLLQAVVLHVFQPLDRRLQVFLAEQKAAAFVLNTIDALQLRAQHFIQQHIRHPPATQRQRLAWRQVTKAQLRQQLQRRNLREMLFRRLKRTHARTSLASLTDSGTRHWPVRSFCIRPRFWVLRAAT